MPKPDDTNRVLIPLNARKKNGLAEDAYARQAPLEQALVLVPLHLAHSGGVVGWRRRMEDR